MFFNWPKDCCSKDVNEAIINNDKKLIDVLKEPPIISGLQLLARLKFSR